VNQSPTKFGRDWLVSRHGSARILPAEPMAYSTQLPNADLQRRIST